MSSHGLNNMLDIDMLDCDGVSPSSQSSAADANDQANVLAYIDTTLATITAEMDKACPSEIFIEVHRKTTRSKSTRIQSPESARHCKTKYHWPGESAEEAWRFGR